MNRSTVWLAFSTALSIGAGFLGGMMYKRRPTPPMPVLGHLYEVDGDTLIDGALVDFLTPRADAREPLPSNWLRLRFRAAALTVHSLSDREALPHQRGALYAVQNDRDARQFLQDMVDLGLVQFVGRWQSWREALHRPSPETSP